MRTRQFGIELSEAERAELVLLISRGKAPARTIRRAHILLAAADDLFDADVAAALHTSEATVLRVRRRFADAPAGERVAHALYDRPRPGAARKLDAKAKRRSSRSPAASRLRGAPSGACSSWRTSWSSSTSSRRSPTRRRGGPRGKNQLEPWRVAHWCTAQVGADFVSRMEDVLDLYAKVAATPDPARPLVRFDEQPFTLRADATQAQRARRARTAIRRGSTTSTRDRAPRAACSASRPSTAGGT